MSRKSAKACLLSSSDRQDAKKNNETRERTLEMALSAVSAA